MITRNKEVGIMSLLFVVVILFLTFSIIKNFDILDLVYLLFMIGCFVRYIYIKTH